MAATPDSDAAEEKTIIVDVAKAPFDNLDGDIILRSTADPTGLPVDFHVFKVILSLMSPVFKDMFTLPQNGPRRLGLSSIPVIPVSENTTTLESLLLLCYPATTPTFNSWDDAKAVMEAAKKYDMQAVLSRAGELAMTQFLPTHFLALYALSLRFGWQHHAQTAATQALEIKDLGRPSTEFDGMQDITALDHHRLLVYHHACGVAAQTIGNSLSWVESTTSSKNITMWSDTAGPGMNQCRCRSGKSDRTLQISDFGNQKVAQWFDEYLVSSGIALRARPCESTLLESPAYHRAITQAVDCSVCRTTIVESMDRFRALYIAQVKKVVATVRLTTSL